MHESLDEIHVATTKVLDFHRSHRRVGRDDRGTVHVLPLWIGSGEEPPPFLCCQGAAHWPLTLRKVVDVISKRSPSAAELQHPRQHADVHVDRAIGDAGVVTCALEVRDGRGCDRGERRVAKVLLDDAEPLFLELDSYAVSTGFAWQPDTR